MEDRNTKLAIARGNLRSFISGSIENQLMEAHIIENTEIAKIHLEALESLIKTGEFTRESVENKRQVLVNMIQKKFGTDNEKIVELREELLRLTPEQTTVPQNIINIIERSRLDPKDFEIAKRVIYSEKFNVSVNIAVDLYMEPMINEYRKSVAKAINREKIAEALKSTSTDPKECLRNIKIEPKIFELSDLITNIKEVIKFYEISSDHKKELTLIVGELTELNNNAQKYNNDMNVAVMKSYENGVNVNTLELFCNRADMSFYKEKDLLINKIIKDMERNDLCEAHANISELISIKNSSIYLARLKKAIENNPNFEQYNKIIDEYSGEKYKNNALLLSSIKHAIQPMCNLRVKLQAILEDSPNLNGLIKKLATQEVGDQILKVSYPEMKTLFEGENSISICQRHRPEVTGPHFKKLHEKYTLCSDILNSETIPDFKKFSTLKIDDVRSAVESLKEHQLISDQRGDFLVNGFINKSRSNSPSPERSQTPPTVY